MSMALGKALAAVAAIAVAAGAARDIATALGIPSVIIALNMTLATVAVMGVVMLVLITQVDILANRAIFLSDQQINQEEY